MSKIENGELGTNDGVISAEHRNLANDLKKISEGQDLQKQKERTYREQALLELGGEAGVFTGNRQDIEQKIAEIKSRETEAEGS